MFEKLKRLSPFGGQKQITSVFIGNSDKCPSFHYYKISKSIKNAQLVHWPKPPENFTDQLTINNGLCIFGHGDLQRNASYFYDSEHRKQFIGDQTWNQFNNNRAITYFHVCFGAEILRKNKILREKFPAWVSYSSEIVTFRSSKYPEIDITTREFLTRTYQSALEAKTPYDLVCLLRKNHQDMATLVAEKSRITNILIAQIGNNLSGLVHV